MIRYSMVVGVVETCMEARQKLCHEHGCLRTWNESHINKMRCPSGKLDADNFGVSGPQQEGQEGQP